MKNKQKVMSEEVDGFGIPRFQAEDQAFERKKAMKTLDDLQELIAEHLILIFSASHDSLNISGWQNELNAWRETLVRRNAGKSGSDNFSRDILYKALWIEPLSTERDRDIRIKHLNRKKGMNILPITVDRVVEFKKFVIRYIDSIENDFEFV